MHKINLSKQKQWMRWIVKPSLALPIFHEHEHFCQDFTKGYFYSEDLLKNRHLRENTFRKITPPHSLKYFAYTSDHSLYRCSSWDVVHLCSTKHKG